MKTLTLFATLSLLILTGCVSGTVSAAAPPPVAAAPTSNPDCSNKWVQDVREGFVALNLGPCTIFVADANNFGGAHGLPYTYTLTRDEHITSIYGWNGTLTEAMEVGNRLKIDTPDGLHREYEVEYDKHSPDSPGEKTIFLRVNLTLPAGTVFTLERTEGIVGDCSGNDGHNCALEFRWVFQED
jgi:hypothetical protein